MDILVVMHLEKQVGYDKIANKYRVKTDVGIVCQWAGV